MYNIKIKYSYEQNSIFSFIYVMKYMGLWVTIFSST